MSRTGELTLIEGVSDGDGPAPSAVGRWGTAGPREFVALVATCIAMAALSIDLMLPAFPEMRESFGLAEGSTQVTWVITAFFLGLGVGQLFYGPLSDRFGRKRLLYAGLVLYVISASAAALSSSLSMLILCRVLWGLGAAAPRSLALAMVRDTFEGDRMARTMSHVMATFILVPVFAPSLGGLLLLGGSWRVVMWVPVGAAPVLAVWALRLPETLPPSKRRAINPAALGQALQAVVRSRRTVAYGLAVTCLFGIMTAYVGSSEVIIDEVFHQGKLFPVIFGALACMLGLGSLLSANLVTRLGLDKLVRYGAMYTLGAAALLATVAVATGGHPPLWAFALTMALLLPGVSMLIPNSNTAAMGPVAHVAGMAAALLGTVSTVGGALLGSVLDGVFNGSVTPFALGAVSLAAVAAFSILVLGRAKA